MSEEVKIRRTFQVLNFGAGVQSTALYLMFRDGVIQHDGVPVQLDAAIFADVQEEGRATYKHLEWLQSLNGPPILIRTTGKLGDDLISGRNSTGQRFASIPAFLKTDSKGGGMGRRQCTKEYKIDVVERTIRRELVGLQPRQRMPKDIKVVQYFGLSYEEMRRVFRVQSRFLKVKWATPRFPLVEMGMTREKCREYMVGRVPHEVPRSACVFCPYKRNDEWRRLRDTDPEGWARAVEIDRAIRLTTSLCAQGFKAEQYLHRSLVPLEEADLSVDKGEKKAAAHGFLEVGDGVEGSACEGMCGL